MFFIAFFIRILPHTAALFWAACNLADFNSKTDCSSGFLHPAPKRGAGYAQSRPPRRVSDKEQAGRLKRLPACAR
ncbi:hypothetical protein HMPREF1051_2391 [Neisseria sicca VK64]|uniref:Lipoprotein n=1 Tax=Neisseria sicca VK64 TaxID=1095748 RepID=I2NN21_NEISI|nr:hypothetical protein HMPREF1051_2391 [Neisseria sicca VK64]